MSKEKKDEQIELFFPYYVNQERLLDIYAILNGGYSEFSEVTASTSTKKDKKGKAEVTFSGFKIFNFGLGATATGELGKSDSTNEEAKERKVHTVTSVLSMVKRELENRGYLHDINTAKPGQFVCLPVNLSINSMQSLMNELSDISKLSNELTKLSGSSSSTNPINTKSIDNITKGIKKLFDGEEILYQTEKFAVIGNIIESNLYQSVSADLIDVDLTCLAQVKRKFDNGTELMKNTIFSKLKDQESKESLIKKISEFSQNNVYDFDAVVVPSIKGKPVFQLEIIALYQ